MAMAMEMRVSNVWGEHVSGHGDSDTKLSRSA